MEAATNGRFFLQLFQDFDSLSEGGHLIGGRLMEGKL